MNVAIPHAPEPVRQSPLRLTRATAGRTGAVDAVAQTGATLIAWATPAIAIAFLAGLVRMRLAGERARRTDAAAELAAVALENRRLEAEAQEAAQAVRESRARIAASADQERRRIERDLHDGAQQRLVALRIELRIVEDMLLDDPAGATARIRELEASAEEALEELRALAHGVHPPLLADRGLVEALHSAIAHSSLPATLHEVSVRRYAPEIESAVYFCVLEALQNVAKHAPGAAHVRVRLNGDTAGELWFDVSDDGPGTANPRLQDGVGITNMRDRLAAIDGALRVTSRRGIGTRVRGRAPVPVGPPQRQQDPR